MKKREESKHFRNGAFRNISDTPVTAKGVSYMGLLKQNMKRPKEVKPSCILPSVKTDLKALSSDEPCIVWFGHSSYLIHVKGVNILVDPVFSTYASPVSFFVKAFAGANAYTVSELPQIDILLITHNHYDHLDAKTVSRLKNKVRRVFTPLGVARDIRLEPVDDRIQEMDWWESVKVTRDIELTATPARHFSGRGLKRGGSLWASFVLKIFGYSIFIGGDSGYDNHFREIGKHHGPFDVAMLECGQYDPFWPYIHMTPEETVQAAKDLSAKMLFPVHWAKFALANHPWNEPVRRVLNSARQSNQQITTPMIGEPVIVNKNYPDKEWWNI